MRLLHAGPDRQRDGAARARPAAEPRADPRGDGGQPLPLRRLPEDRARDPARGGERRDGAARQDAEGDGGALRGRLGARRRGGRPRDVAGRRGPVARRAARPRGWTAPRGPPAASRTRSTSASPGMLHAAVLRSPVAHGARALARPRRRPRDAPGVRAVLGPESELSLTTRAPLLASEPVYAGQPIAVVAADTPEAAPAGVRALAARGRAAAARRRPARGPARAALHARADRGRPRRRRRGARGRRGDASSSSSRRPPTCRRALEPHAAVASWDGDDLTAWVSTQGMFSRPRGARRRLRRSRKDQVRVIAEFIGGGFGAKQGAGFEALAAAELARITGRPVRLVNDRHAEQLDGGRRARDAADRAARGDAATGRWSRSTRTRSSPWGRAAGSSRCSIPALTLYRCEDVRAMTFPLQDEPARPERVPRPRRDRGDRGASSRRWTSSRSRSASIRSSCAAATTSTSTR